MKSTVRPALVASLFATLALSTPAMAGSGGIGTVSNFTANLSGTSCTNPEGIAADPAGNLYSASDIDGATVGTVCVFNPSGTLSRTIPVPAGPSGVVVLIGLAFWQYLVHLERRGRHWPTGRLLSINTVSGAVTVVTTGFQFPNGVALDGTGERVRVGLGRGDGCPRTARRNEPDRLVRSDPLLSTTGFPPLGANGIAFDSLSHNLYVTNTGDSRVLALPVKANGSASGPDLRRWRDDQSAPAHHRGAARRETTAWRSTSSATFMSPPIRRTRSRSCRPAGRSSRGSRARRRSSSTFRPRWCSRAASSISPTRRSSTTARIPGCSFMQGYDAGLAAQLSPRRDADRGVHERPDVTVSAWSGTRRWARACRLWPRSRASIASRGTTRHRIAQGSRSRCFVVRALRQKKGVQLA